VKTFLRTTKASSSTARRVEIVVRNGWCPGQSARDFYRRAKRPQQSPFADAMLTEIAPGGMLGIMTGAQNGN
jgi:hypothetical protein